MHPWRAFSRFEKSGTNPTHCSSYRGLSFYQVVANLVKIPDAGLLCDLLWADPDGDTSGWGENDRGVSFTFGADVVENFLKRHEFDLIVRAHQVCLFFYFIS